jgi:hypothetical protein
MRAASHGSKKVALTTKAYTVSFVVLDVSIAAK